MRVGIDARLLTHQVTGIGRYTAELTQELIKQPGDFFLYSPGPIVVGQWSAGNVTRREMNFRRRATRMLWSQSFLPWLAQKDNLDVFWGPAHRLPWLLPSSVARVVTIHDLVWKHATETMRPMSRIVERRLMPAAVRQADLIVAVSSSTARAVEEEWPETGNRIRIIHSGVTDLPAPVDTSILRHFGIDRPYFLFVGTLEPRKNLARLLKAYALLNPSLRNRFRMVIAGGKGWGGIDMAALIKQNRLEGQVVLTGYVDDAQLATLYSQARFLAMPSIYEGFGLPLVEAMRFGVPVLTSDTSSMPEVAGDAGVLVDPLDEASIARGLELLLSGSVDLRMLSDNAIKQARKFDWNTASKKMWVAMKEASQIHSAPNKK